MIRNLTIVAVASFVLCVGCFAGAFALGGRDLIEHGWTIPSDWNVEVNDDNDTIHVGPGHQTAEERETTTRQIAWKGGDSLQVDVPAEVIFTQAAPGAGAGVKITGPKRLVDRVMIEDGRISLKGDGDYDGTNSLKINGHGVQVLGGEDRLSIEVTAPAVRSFTLNGSGDLYLKAYDQPDLRLEINGSGAIDAQGKAGKVDLQVSGSGEADLRSLDTGDAQVVVSGSGEAHVAPHGAAEVELAGSGDVYLTSKPTVLTSNVAGSGEVHQDW
uniref:Putative auto-transporter adhesin head GIN domain-containing protein n=1 Tax=Caulobacter sp. (strain K31) TaxID=366602 RepID=B0T0Y1_CAUSK